MRFGWPVSPHPNPLPIEEGETRFEIGFRPGAFLPSPFGRRVGDEGLREEPIFLFCAPWAFSHAPLAPWSRSRATRKRCLVPVASNQGHSKSDSTHRCRAL